MTVEELFDKYCKKSNDGEYIVHGSCFTLNPATEEELEIFKKLCAEFNVEQCVSKELSDYYSQNSENIMEISVPYRNFKNRRSNSDAGQKVRGIRNQKLVGI